MTLRGVGQRMVGRGRTRLLWSRLFLYGVLEKYGKLSAAISVPKFTTFTSEKRLCSFGEKGQHVAMFYFVQSTKSMEWPAQGIHNGNMKWMRFPR